MPSERILIVDDDDMVRETIALLLSTEGYRVFSYATVASIVDCIKKVDPDVILLDILLGDSDGRDLCRQIKSHPEVSHIPVIMLSGLPEVYNAIMEVGANDIISKPFDGRILLNRIARQLSNSALR